MKDLKQKELININGGNEGVAFHKGREFAEDVYNATGEVVHVVADFIHGLLDGLF